MFTFNIHILADNTELLEAVREIRATLAQHGVLLMGLSDDLKTARQELAAANDVTNEIAADVADLVQRAIDAPANSADAKALLAEAQALKVRLQEVAASHTPE